MSNPQAKNNGVRRTELQVPGLGNDRVRQYGARRSTALFRLIENAVSIVFAPVATQGEFDGR